VTAANAARHFTQHSHERGDVSSAALWSSIARAIAGPAPIPARARAMAEPSPADTIAIRRIRESIAFQGVRYEDVDAETLARDEPTAAVIQPSGEWGTVRPRRFGFVRAGLQAERVARESAASDAPALELARAA